MKPTSRTESLPPDKRKEFHRAVKWEWISVFAIALAALLMYLTAGNSQAMKTAFIEDVLSLVPSISFLIVQKLFNHRPNRRFPYGYYRAQNLGFLIAAASLLAVGLFLVYHNLTALIKAEHPTIGAITLFGQTFWLGWLMLAALVYATFMPVLLGLKKLKMARSLHDKVLYTSAAMNKADWLSGSAAIVGVIMIGFGFWWADAVAALVISVDVMHDGYSNMKAVFRDLMDGVPTTVDHKQEDPIPKRIEEAMQRMNWIRDVRIRMREHGSFLFGEIFVVPREDIDLATKFSEARQLIESMDWRIQEVVFVPVQNIAVYPSNSAPITPDEYAKEQ